MGATYTRCDLYYGKYGTLPKDVHMWVTDRKAKTTADTAQLAENYFQARPAGAPKPVHILAGPCSRCGEGKDIIVHAPLRSCSLWLLYWAGMCQS